MHGNMGPTPIDATTNGFGDHKPKKSIQNFIVTGMSCLDRGRTATFGYRIFTAKNHYLNPSLIHNSNIHPDNVRAGL